MNKTDGPIVVKIGSSLLTQEDGRLNTAALESYAMQLAGLIKLDWQVILVSSGAVASGMQHLKNKKRHKTVVQQQLAAAIGQVKLMHAYSSIFEGAQIVCAQVLATKVDFSGRQHYLNMKTAISAMLSEGILPIVNENDTVAVEELMFTDNDELAALVAAMLNAQSTLLLTNVDGLYDGDPHSSEAQLLAHIAPDDTDRSPILSPNKSKSGRGGMISKYRSAVKMQQQGIEVIIANGLRPNIIEAIVQDKEIPCTRFHPVEKTANGIKTWLANSNIMVKGKVVINKGAREALHQQEGKSLLFAGVEQVIGDFKRHELVQVCDEQMNILGVGRVHFDANTSHQLIGASGQKPLIHRNYLYMY